MRIETLDETSKKNLLEDLLKRSPNSYAAYEASVQEILDNVRREKDAAVFAYTKKFDGADIDAGNIIVTEEEITEAYAQVDENLLRIIRKALNGQKPDEAVEKLLDMFARTRNNFEFVNMVKKMKFI